MVRGDRKAGRDRKEKGAQKRDAARVSLVESLEDRRLHSASPVGAASFSWGATQSFSWGATQSFSWGATQQGTFLAESDGDASSFFVNKASPKLM